MGCQAVCLFHLWHWTSKLRASANHVARWERNYQTLQSTEDLEYKVMKEMFCCERQSWSSDQRNKPQTNKQNLQKKPPKKINKTHKKPCSKPLLIRQQLLRRPDKNAGIFTAAFRLGLRWLRGVVGLAKTGILTGLYCELPDCSWLTEEGTLIVYINICSVENRVARR